MLHKTSLKPPPVFIFLNFNLLQSIVLALICLESSWIFTTSLALKTSEPLHLNITQSDQMPLLSDQELRAIVDRIRYLETELKEAKILVAVLESNLMAAKKPDLNAGNEGVAGLGDLLLCFGIAVENNSKDNDSEQAAFTDVDGDRCRSCGRGASEAEVRGGNETYRQPIPRAACCVITRAVDADGEFQTRYTNTTLGGSNDGEWHAPSPEGGSMGAQISGSIELLADRVREDWGCERVFYKVFPDLPDEFNRVLMNHTQMRRTTNAGNDLETGELVLGYNWSTEETSEQPVVNPVPYRSLSGYSEVVSSTLVIKFELME
ncbi:hypothetical protein ACKLNR_006303 [Fusarium oxysporum f. sp. zingiberi]